MAAALESGRSSGNELHDFFLVKDPDGQQGRSHIHRVSEYGLYTRYRYDIGFVDAEELFRRKNTLHFAHGLMGNDGMFYSMDF